jgi:hypothetical protein
MASANPRPAVEIARSVSGRVYICRTALSASFFAHTQITSFPSSDNFHQTHASCQNRAVTSDGGSLTRGAGTPCRNFVTAPIFRKFADYGHFSVKPRESSFGRKSVRRRFCCRACKLMRKAKQTGKLTKTSLRSPGMLFGKARRCSIRRSTGLQDLRPCFLQLAVETSVF